MHEKLLKLLLVCSVMLEIRSSYKHPQLLPSLFYLPVATYLCRGLRGFSGSVILSLPDARRNDVVFLKKIFLSFKFIALIISSLVLGILQ